MKTTIVRTGLALTLVTFVAACGGDNGLINISRKQVGPDEFAILPGKPIEVPEDLSALPAPTPGLSNRTDPTPHADAVAALGGNPARLEPTGRTTDGALVNSAGRYGTDPNIREDLAVADAEFRRRNRGKLLERLFGLTTYYDAYSRQSLDQHNELDRYRGAGARTPGAPPESVE